MGTCYSARQIEAQERLLEAALLQQGIPLNHGPYKKRYNYYHSMYQLAYRHNTNHNLAWRMGISDEIDGNKLPIENLVILCQKDRAKQSLHLYLVRSSALSKCSADTVAKWRETQEFKKLPNKDSKIVFYTLTEAAWYLGNNSQESFYMITALEIVPLGVNKTQLLQDYLVQYNPHAGYKYRFAEHWNDTLNAVGIHVTYDLIEK
jgi:hypothetical protein